MDNLDAQERDKFSALADEWWDRDGPQRALHDLNPCRMDYVAATLPLDGARALDVGCGGGLLSEALARAGAAVTAIDASEPLVGVAREHAQRAALDIDYRCMLAAELATTDAAGYDLVTCMELLEHVPDPAGLLADCARLLRPGGALVVSTINRSPLAWLGAVVSAEYLVGLLPRGTHDYARFIRPSELLAAARSCGLEPTDVSGMRYDPLTRRATLTPVPRINYLARMSRPAARH